MQKCLLCLSVYCLSLCIFVFGTLIINWCSFCIWFLEQVWCWWFREPWIRCWPERASTGLLMPSVFARHSVNTWDWAIGLLRATADAILRVCSTIPSSWLWLPDDLKWPVIIGSVWTQHPTAPLPGCWSSDTQPTCVTSETDEAQLYGSKRSTHLYGRGCWWKDREK